MANDDGRLTGNLNEADIILIGVSRTSKTPTSIYLANHHPEIIIEFNIRVSGEKTLKIVQIEKVQICTILHNWAEWHYLEFNGFKFN